MQWIGDCNQNIYGGSGKPWTPGEDCLDLGGSKRFGHKTAAFASRLTMVRPQVISGEEGRDALHSIFFFDRDTVGNVIPAYCAALAATDQFHGDAEIWAVAARHKIPEEARKAWPNSIGDYWPEYAHPKPYGERAGTLLGVLLEARHRTAATGSPQEALSAFGSALFRFLQALGWKPHDAARSQSALWQALEAASPGSRLRMRTLLKSTLTTGLPIDADGWRRFAGPVADLAKDLTGARPDMGGFLAFEGHAAAHGGTDQNVHIWEEGGARLKVRLGTIHSVKGQTHDATLVLETNEGQKMDVAGAVTTAFLGGERPKGKQVTKALMNIFVGATRPRRALCLATRREAVDADLEKAILAAGWSVHDLTVG
ncbi:MAG: hypothetical protein H7Y60_06725 [Rhodospirillaceae bacterium]|nr:hypothetical protein [Rhodospirillales bacterium]